MNSSIIIGCDCCICRGATIGVSGHGPRRGVPAVVDRVYFGGNVAAVGKIWIGDDLCVGANPLVNRSVPSHCTVVGVQASIVSERGSEDYIGTGMLLNGKCPDGEILL